MNQTANDLRAAAQAIRDRGWCQGRMYDQISGAVCALGGIREATNGTDQHPGQRQRFLRRKQAEDALMHALNLPPDLTDELAAVAMWNDDPGQTAEGVLAGFEQAAARAELEVR